jgi:hypothetical protein
MPAVLFVGFAWKLLGHEAHRAHVQVETVHVMLGEEADSQSGVL